MSPLLRFTGQPYQQPTVFLKKPFVLLTWGFAAWTIGEIVSRNPFVPDVCKRNPMRRTKIAVISLALALVLGAATARATTLFTFSAGQPTGLVGNGTFNIGNAFQVGATPLAVTNIGAYVDGDQAAGLTTVRFLANIYAGDGSGNLLSSTPVPIGTPVDSQGFAYVPLSTTLSAGVAYWLTDIAVDAGGNAINTPFAYNSSGGFAGTWTGASFIANVYKSNPVPAAQAPDTINNSFKEFLGGNLQFVPEPGSGVLLVLGALGLIGFFRRRKS